MRHNIYVIHKLAIVSFFLASPALCLADDDTYPYVDFVFNGSGTSDYSLTCKATKCNIDDSDCRNFTLDGCTVECVTSNLTITGVDENGFTLFKLTDGSTTGTISISVTDNGVWAGYHYTTAYQMNHKQVSLEACLVDGDGGYVDDDEWVDVVVQGQIDWENKATRGDTVVRAPKGSYEYTVYGSGSTTEEYAVTDPDNQYPYYKATFTSSSTVNDKNYGTLSVGTPDLYTITISGLQEGQTIGLRDVTLRERLTVLTQEVPRLDVTLNYTDAATPAITSEFKDTGDKMLGFNFDTTSDDKNCVVSSSLSGGTVTGVDEKGFVKLNASDAANDVTLTLKMAAAGGESTAFNWAKFFQVFHYEVSYDVFLLGTDGETYLHREDWGDVEVDGQLSWCNTYDKKGGTANTGAKISSSTVSNIVGSYSDTDYDAALIMSEHELEDGTVYYSVFYTGDLTDDWLEIWGYDQLPVKISNLAEGQTIALRNVTITCRLTNADEYLNYMDGNQVSNADVLHKKAKWYEVRERTSSTFSYDDNFDEDNPWTTLANGTQVQATHEMVDTIYMLKGTSMTILIPQNNANGSYSVNNYFRWYNYLNDKNLYLGDENTGLGSDSDIFDLVTPGPSYSSDIDAYRFSNGYVSGYLNSSSGSTLGQISFYYPTDDEFKSISGTLGQTDNSYYVIACDLSIYNDFSSTDSYIPNYNSSKPFSVDNLYSEPTLAGRDLYYIIGIDPTSESSTAPEALPEEFKHYWQLFDTSYQGGGNEGKNYLEELEITMPSHRISTNTNEMVALTKDAQSYALPGETSPGALTVAFATDDNENEFTLVSSSLSGTSRVIQFYKGTSKAAWEVNDQSTATILVTKTVGSVTYNLVRYKLTFKDECIPLTEAQVHALDSVPDECSWWKDMYYRSPNYIEENYKLITSLDFDYGGYGDDENNSKVIYNSITRTSSVVYPGQLYNYPFPLNWDACSYFFYDGSYDVNPQATNLSSFTAPSGVDSKDMSYRVQASWCMYNIVNWNVGYGEANGGLKPTESVYPYVKNHEGNWLYLDASDRPGTVAELTFDNDLCPGAQMVVTAWIKSDGYNTSNQNDAAVMLTVMGVTKNDDGSETHTPIYRQYSGQIEVTTLLTEEGVEQGVSGKGEGTNEWFETYFTFKTPDEDYDYYTVRVDNYCASTSGGDFYFDEVCVWARNATVDATQEDVACSSDVSSKSLVKVNLDYESLLQYLSNKDPQAYLTEEVDDVETETLSIDFVIVDRVVYEDFIAQHSSEVGTDKTYQSEEKLKEAAIEKAATYIYPAYDADEEDPYGTGEKNLLLNFYDYFYKNAQYDDSEGVELPEEEDGKYYLYHDDSNSSYTLTCELYVDFDTYTDYAIIIEANDKGETDDDWQSSYVELIASPCAIGTEFFLIPRSMFIKVDGEALDPTVTACVGQTSLIEPEVDLSVLVGEDEVVTLSDDIYFDWFFGTIDEYQTAQTVTIDGTETELSSLEEALSHFRSLYSTATEPEWTETEADDDYTETDYTTIKYYCDLGKLVLRRKSLEVTMEEAEAESSGGIRLVIRPIKVTITVESTDITDDVCWDAVSLSVLADGYSPSISPGFSYITGYPDGYFPSLRLGASQAEEATEDSPLTVSLRGVDYADDENGYEVSGLREITSKEGLNHLFLVSTSDPNYSELLGSEDFNRYSIPVGTVKTLTGTKASDEAAEVGSMEIYFNFGDDYPAFREGYSYTVSVYFEEDESDDSYSCLGTFPLEIKVVPEYLVWQGDETSNWNDDSKWQRATKQELKGLEGYEDYDDEDNSGFVPMSFTKVVIPEGKAAELYMAGFAAVEGEDDAYEWKDNVEDYEPAYTTDSPTDNIQYDLLAIEDEETGKLTTQHFRTAVAGQLHLEPGAMLLHPELLLYDKAWTDVRVAQDEWLLTSTPLKGVVAGDWYTGTGGTEPTPYFTDITFSADESHSRLNPLVFQRSWGSDATMVYSDADDATLPAYTLTDWTSVYNDASVAQTAGAGFSVEAELSSQGTYGTGTDSITFRFPKADDSYTYQSGTLSREDTGKLLVSSLSDRGDPYNDADASSVYPEANSTLSVTLTPSADGYCLVGNPFTAKMSLKAFFEQNADVLQNEYWLETTQGPVWGSGSLTSLGDDDVLIEPYSAFFAKAKETDSGTSPTTLTVQFTRDMQTLDQAPSNNVKAFLIRATGSRGASGAAVVQTGEADDGYNDGEDIVLMRGLTGQAERAPMVYTEAGGKAVSLNRQSALSVIPLGVYADADEQYTLTFQGVDHLGEPVLYDALENTKTTLEDGDTLRLEGASHGRFYILTSGIGEPQGGAEPCVSVSSLRKGELSVSSTEEIRRVEVYSAGGLLLGSLSLGEGRVACSLEGLPQGLALVQVTTGKGTTARKVIVK
ncbi:MAG: hypothetical protein LUC86_00380 [Prevotellaceae bacterium]|nr:hypothetical protein [Prevotellaceae bacterium]